ncbi:hypothetical protein Tco_0745280 [Tanacetum coccineum]
MDRSFTLGSTEEADNVKILQSCNGLLLCGGSGLPVFITAGLRTVTPLDGAWTEYVSGGVTLLSISSTKHKERPLRNCFGDGEQISFFGDKLSRKGKVVQYDLISKTLHEIYDCGSNQLDDNHDDDDDDDEFLQHFEAEHNVYELIPSFTSV